MKKVTEPIIITYLYKWFWIYNSLILAFSVEIVLLGVGFLGTGNRFRFQWYPVLVGTR